MCLRTEMLVQCSVNLAGKDIGAKRCALAMPSGARAGLVGTESECLGLLRLCHGRQPSGNIFPVVRSDD
jgi:hypothetical protein